MFRKIVLSWDGLDCAAVDPSRCAQKFCAMEGRQRKGKHQSTAFTSPGRLWEHSCPATVPLRCPAVCPSVHPSIHHSAEPSLPNESPAQPCWRWVQGQGLMFLHQTRPEKEENPQEGSA